jgi:hypothetical protein
LDPDGLASHLAFGGPVQYKANGGGIGTNILDRTKT